VPRDISTGKRIAKVVRLFSTTNDGEALAAVRALQRLLVELGTDLHHLAEIIEANWTAPVVDLFDHKREPKLQPWQIFAAELLRHEHDPRIVWGSRERDFLHNMKRLRTAPTAPQEKWLNDIAARRRAA
jgi:hypothetical protein